MISDLAMHFLLYERVGLICKFDNNLISSAREGLIDKAAFSPSGNFKLTSNRRYIILFAIIVVIAVNDPAG